jgi:hypothetical protein
MGNHHSRSQNARCKLNPTLLFPLALLGFLVVQSLHIHQLEDAFNLVAALQPK